MCVEGVWGGEEEGEAGYTELSCQVFFASESENSRMLDSFNSGICWLTGSSFIRSLIPTPRSIEFEIVLSVCINEIPGGLRAPLARQAMVYESIRECSFFTATVR